MLVVGFVVGYLFAHWERQQYLRYSLEQAATIFSWFPVSDISFIASSVGGTCVGNPPGMAFQAWQSLSLRETERQAGTRPAQLYDAFIIAANFVHWAGWGYQIPSLDRLA